MEVAFGAEELEADMVSRIQTEKKRKKLWKTHTK
jgi:hypothetical protein